MAASENPLIQRARRRIGGVLRRVGLRRTAQQPEPEYGPKPEVVLERTNFGPMVDEMVARVRRNQRRYGVNADYDFLREHFDHYRFMLQASALHEDPEADPIRIFLRTGAKAVGSPDINFSMQKYLARYPERAEGPERSPYLEWIKRGKDAGEIADPADGIESLAPLLGLTPQQTVDEIVRLRTDMMQRLRTGILGEMFAKAVELEPLIGKAWPQTIAETKQLPFRNDLVARAVAALHACHQNAGYRRARLVIVTNRPRWGGGRRLEGHLAHALAERIDPAEIVVIFTDQGGTSPEGRFPDGVREIDFATHFADVRADHRAEALVALLRSFGADAILNINSAALYHAMTWYGRALADSERLFLVFFCNEQNALGAWEGWSLRWFYPAFEYVAGVITDSEYLRDELVERYLLSDSDRERVHVFRTPAEPELQVAAAPAVEASRRPVVYWAGRFDRQKRPDLAIEVARRMPDIDFRFWGERVLTGNSLGSLPENVTLEGRFERFADLDLAGVDAWLYTSAWDGVPSLLLEVGMTEVPIVASLVGGVGEAICEDCAWPVADRDEPEAYEKALREILADPVRARERSRLLRERLLRDRSQDVFRAFAAELLLKTAPTGTTTGTTEEEATG